jgi:peptidoglycan/xylan/chitin deacetylase (PgdA/CDA1 family)
MSLEYHDVVDGDLVSHPDIRTVAALYSLTRTHFQDHLRSIRQQNAQVDVIRSFRRWQNRLPVLLTFDDGALNACCAADELEKNGWRGHFFVVTNWIGHSEFLNGRQIRDLRDRGHVIGSHSCSHPERMSHLSRTETTREWSESCAVLSDILGESVKVASVPNGYYSREVARAAAAAGLEVLFTTEATATCSVIDGCLILGRYLIHWNTPAETAGAIAAGNLWPRWKQTLLWEAKKLLKGIMGESYLAARRAILAGWMPHAQTSCLNQNVRRQPTRET